jgi:hypothetical protein
MLAPPDSVQPVDQPLEPLGQRPLRYVRHSDLRVLFWFWEVGSWAVSVRPLALRPRLATGLPLATICWSARIADS